MPTDNGFKKAAFYAMLAVIPAATVSNSLFEIASIALMILALISFFIEKRWEIIRGWFAGLILLYLIACAASFLATDYPKESWRGLFKVVRHALLCLSVVYVADDRKKIVLMFRVAMVVAIVIGLDALYQWFFGVDLFRARESNPYLGEIHRVTGPYKHANDFAAYLCLTLFVLLSFAKEGVKPFHGKWRIFSLVGLSLLGVSLVATLSRGGWVGAGAGFIVYGILRRSRWVAAVLVGLVIWGFFLSPPVLRERIRSSLDLKDNTIQLRSELWSEAMRMIRKSPVIGLGVNTYAKNEPKFKADNPTADNTYPHNGYLQMGAEIGFFGLFSFLSFLIYFFSVSVRRFNRAADPFTRAATAGLLAGIFAFLVHAASDTNLHSLLLINSMWFAVGLTWALGRSEAKRQ